jgi:hypothetical protein
LQTFDIADIAYDRADAVVHGVSLSAAAICSPYSRMVCCNPK